MLVGRIDPEYFKRGDKLQRGKRLLAVVAALVPAAWLAAGWAKNDRSPYSPGQLAWVHATWDQQCLACHADFNPIREDAWLGNGQDARHEVDARCQSCHSGPEHHHKPELDQKHCADCHLEHQGRETQLTRIASQTCVDCHNDLKMTENLRVTKFGKDTHPEFSSLPAIDPGRLKFSHSIHLAPGLTVGDIHGPSAQTLDKIAPDMRAKYEQYARNSADGVFQLGCAACHQLDAVDEKLWAAGAGSPVSESRSSGAYMRSISYEQHCRACHPLNFVASEGRTFAADSPDLLPHGLKNEQILLFLQRAYSERVLNEHPQVANKIPASPETGRLPSHREPIDDSTIGQKRAQGVESASAALRSKCLKCHELPAQDPWSMEVDSDIRVPQVWFKHARFDHTPHRAIKCVECHANATITGARPAAADDQHDDQLNHPHPWLDQYEVLIPRMQKCLECHSDQAVGGAARTDCVECHTYHNAPNARADGSADFKWLQGRGANRRNAKKTFNVSEFLQGVYSSDDEH